MKTDLIAGRKRLTHTPPEWYISMGRLGQVYSTAEPKGHHKVTNSQQQNTKRECNIQALGEEKFSKATEQIA
jgi:hypothetical protein